MCRESSRTALPLWNQLTTGRGSACMRHSNTSLFPSSSCLIAGFFAKVGASPSICLRKQITLMPLSNFQIQFRQPPGYKYDIGGTESHFKFSKSLGTTPYMYQAETPTTEIYTRKETLEVQDFISS